jgi:hypothetical protein
MFSSAPSTTVATSTSSLSRSIFPETILEMSSRSPITFI